jgi:hypothetical protein
MVCGNGRWRAEEISLSGRKRSKPRILAENSGPKPGMTFSIWPADWHDLSSFRLQRAGKEDTLPLCPEAVA